MHAVLFARVVQGIFRSNPLETCSRGSLVKNGLIVDKTTVVFIACVVIPDVPNKSG